MMKLVICLLWILDLSFGERAKFEFVPSFQKRALFSESFLVELTETSPRRCAQHCFNHTQCAVFSWNVNVGVCMLYGDICYPNSTNVSPLVGQQYYAYVEDWCSLENGFLMLRESKLCLKITEDEMKYSDALMHCSQYGGQVVVLDTEAKATALVNLLQKLGLSSTEYYIGLTDDVIDGSFMWKDGQPFTPGVLLWHPNQPGGASAENCVALEDGKMHDFPCSTPMVSICQMTETKDSVVSVGMELFEFEMLAFEN